MFRTQNGMTEAEIIAALLEKNEIAISAIRELFGPGLLKFAEKKLGHYHQAQEVVNDAFVDLWKLKTKDFPTLKQVRIYLYIATKGYCQERREKNFKIENVKGAYMDILSGEEPPDLLLEIIHSEVAALIDKKLEESLSEMPNRYRTIIILFYLKGLKLSEIARQLNIKVQTVKNLKEKALIKLRDITRNRALGSKTKKKRRKSSKK